MSSRRGANWRIYVVGSGGVTGNWRWRLTTTLVADKVQSTAAGTASPPTATQARSWCRPIASRPTCTCNAELWRSIHVEFSLSADSKANKAFLIHDLLFLPISTIESAVGKRLITHCCVSCLACSCLSGHIELHSPRLQAWNQHNYDGHELS